MSLSTLVADNATNPKPLRRPLGALSRNETGERWTGFVGRTDDGSRVWVQIELREKEGHGRETVTHEHIEGVATYTESAITGSAVPHRCREVSGAGQVTDTVAAVTRPAPGLTLDDIAELVELWSAWHLNGMRAACAAQTVVWESDSYYPRPSLELTAPCPDTGYRYGTAWLVEELPARVEARIRALAAKLDGSER